MARQDVSRWAYAGGDLRTEYERLKALPCWRKWKVEAEIASTPLRVRRSKKFYSTGHYKPSARSIHVTVGTGPWHTVSRVLLHEMVHRACDALKLDPSRGDRRAYHHIGFHLKLLEAACQAYGISPDQVLSLYWKRGGPRKAYSMDEALDAVLCEKFKDAPGMAVPQKRRPGHSRVLADGRIEVQVPSRAVETVCLDDPVVQKEYGVECIYVRRGRGWSVLLRGKRRDLRHVMVRFMDHSSQRGYAESAAEAAACKTAYERMKAALTL